MNYSKAYYNGLSKCINRYQKMIKERASWDGWVKWNGLYDFMIELESGILKQHPIPKLNRWIGYIEGVLIERGLTTVKAERDFTRPLFKHLDFPEEYKPSNYTEGEINIPAYGCETLEEFNEYNQNQTTFPDGSLTDLGGQYYR